MNGGVQVGELCSTQADIAQNDLVVLTDDLATQPADAIAPIVRNDLLRALEAQGVDVAAILDPVSAAITTEDLTTFNLRVGVNHEDVDVVAREFLDLEGSGPAALRQLHRDPGVHLPSAARAVAIRRPPCRCGHGLPVVPGCAGPRASIVPSNAQVARSRRFRLDMRSARVPAMGLVAMLLTSAIGAGTSVATTGTGPSAASMSIGTSDQDASPAAVVAGEPTAAFSATACPARPDA